MDAFVQWLLNATIVRHVVVTGANGRREVKVLVSDEKKDRGIKLGNRTMAQKNGHALMIVKRKQNNKMAGVRARLLRIKQQEKQHGNS